MFLTYFISLLPISLALSIKSSSFLYSFLFSFLPSPGAAMAGMQEDPPLYLQRQTAGSSPTTLMDEPHAFSFEARKIFGLHKKQEITFLRTGYTKQTISHSHCLFLSISLFSLSLSPLSLSLSPLCRSLSLSSLSLSFSLLSFFSLFLSPLSLSLPPTLSLSLSLSLALDVAPTYRGETQISHTNQWLGVRTQPLRFLKETKNFKS